MSQKSAKQPKLNWRYHFKTKNQFSWDRVDYLSQKRK